MSECTHDCSTCSADCASRKPESLLAPQNAMSNVKKVPQRDGYGLGMYLVKWYMEKQGGGMNYYNDNGFVVELLIRKV